MADLFGTKLRLSHTEWLNTNATLLAHWTFLSELKNVVQMQNKIKSNYTLLKQQMESEFSNINSLFIDKVIRGETVGMFQKI